MQALMLAISMNATEITLLSIMGLLVLLSLFVLVTGLRGRKIDGHPLCRTCGHDLYGSTNAVRNCPKCGRALRYRKDIRVGNRRKSKSRIYTGISGFFIANIMAVFAIFPAARTTDWLPEMPRLSMPRFTLTSKLQTQEDWQQAYQQLATANISQSQANRMARVAVELQEDQSRDWIDAAGLFVEKVHEQSKLDDKLWMRYVNNVIDEQVAAIELPVRPVIDHGTRPYFEIYNCPPKRSGELRLDFLGSDGKSRVQVNDDRIYSLHHPDDEDWKTLPTGKVNLRFLMVQRYCFKHVYDEETRKWKSDNGEVFERLYEMLKSITILPKGKTSVTPVENSNYQAAVEQSVEIYTASFNPKYGHISVQFRINQVPVSLAWVAKVKIRDKWYPLEYAVRFKKGESSNVAPQGYFKDLINASIDTIDVVLSPSDEAAKRSLDITEYWDGELTFENVPVKVVEK
jgi:predicted RNA-binding Zn-ribbon protein involved in translation (DUF1610 family)